MTVLSPSGTGAGVGGSAGADPPITVWGQPSTSIGHLLVQSATISHLADSTSGDGYGNPLKYVSAIDIAPAYLGPWQELEQLVEAETETTYYRLILGPGVPLAAGDTFVIGATSYRVMEALHMIHPRTGVEHHVEAKCTSETG